jgi:hypothetical protein
MRSRAAAYLLAGLVLLLATYWFNCRQLAVQTSAVLCEWLATDLPTPPASMPTLGPTALRRLQALQPCNCVCELGDTPHAETAFEQAIWVSSPKAHNAIALRYAANWPDRPRILGFWTPA